MTLVKCGATLFGESSRLLTVALVVSCLLIPTLAQPTNDKSINNADQVKATVAHLEDQWLNALNTANVDAIADILADDFVRPAPDSGQFVTKADLMSYYRSHLKPISPEQRRIDNMTVSVYGTVAIARGLVIRSAADAHVISKLLFTDVFVQQKNKWQAVSAQENPVTTPQSSSH